MCFYEYKLIFLIYYSTYKVHYNVTCLRGDFMVYFHTHLVDLSQLNKVFRWKNNKGWVGDFFSQSTSTVTNLCITSHQPEATKLNRPSPFNYYNCPIVASFLFFTTTTRYYSSFRFINISVYDLRSQFHYQLSDTLARHLHKMRISGQIGAFSLN